MAQSSQARIKWARWLLIGLAGLLVTGAIAFLLAPRPVSVEVATVGRGPIDEAVADQGYARVREAYVIAAPVAGHLRRLDFHVGDRVEAGKTVVARIEPASSEFLDPRAHARAAAAVAMASAAVSSAEAQREQAEAEALKADQDLSRARTLEEKGYVSRQGLETAETLARARAAALRAAVGQLAMRRSELAAARAGLLGPEARSEGTVAVTSPASGYVTRVLQESERSVLAGAPLVEVSDHTGLEGAIEFLSQDAVRIRDGMPAEIYDWGGPVPLAAVVRRVEPQAFTKVSPLGVEEQRVLVYLQLKGQPPDAERLGPGYRIWGRVFLRRAPNAVKAPLGALVRSRGGWAVYRLVDDHARLTPITVGAVTSREAEVPAGLKPGERVIVFPSDLVRDGARVRVREAS